MRNFLELGKGITLIMVMVSFTLNAQETCGTSVPDHSTMVDYMTHISMIKKSGQIKVNRKKVYSHCFYCAKK